MKNQFTIIKVDHGLGRIVYRGQNEQGELIYYCLQHNCYRAIGMLPTDMIRGLESTVQLYRCGKAPDYEPSHKATARVPLRELFEIPEGETHLDKDIAEHIRKF